MTRAMDDRLGSVDHVVVLMLENRSFDHMLGYLYSDAGNRSPAGDAYDGLTGEEWNPTTDGARATVFPIVPGRPDTYFRPGSDPGEGYYATNAQLFGTEEAPRAGAPPSNDGFVRDYARTLGWERRDGAPVWPGTRPEDIMGMHTPETLPVLSALARGYCVCDSWFSSVPTETMPNRAFASAATSQGHMNDEAKTFTVPSIFGRLSDRGLPWSIYGYSQEPLTRLNFPDTRDADESHFGLFEDFRRAAAGGSLGCYSFLEPSWESTGNSQHPNYDVALGEQLVLDVYRALRAGPAWASTLLVVTYDEHGGCYDHVAPPWGATAPDASIGEDGFDFQRFGLRVPTILVSPWVRAGSVFRVADAGTPLDHTSILRTLEHRWALQPLTARDAAAEDVSGALSLESPRDDDPLEAVEAPVATGRNWASDRPSHLQRIHAELVSALPVTGEVEGVPGREALAAMRTTAEYRTFIQSRTAAWSASRRGDRGR